MVRQNHSDDAADEQTATSRFAAIREADFFTREHKSDKTVSDLLGYIHANGGRQSNIVDRVQTVLYSPDGLGSPTRRGYEVTLSGESDALVPEHVSRVASYRGLEVTDAKYEDGQAVLLLEPTDTERFPRRDA